MPQKLYQVNAFLFEDYDFMADEGLSFTSLTTS